MELSEEEKIERLLNSIAKGCDGSIADEVKAIIIKQQKEIEELKKPKYIIDFKTHEITKLTNDFLSKDKIREKIKELKGNKDFDLDVYTEEFVIDILQELLEENDE